MEELDGVELIDTLRFRVLGRAEVVDGLPFGSAELESFTLLVSESSPVPLAFGDINVLMLAISRSLLCWSLFGLW